MGRKQRDAIDLKPASRFLVVAAIALANFAALAADAPAKPKRLPVPDRAARDKSLACVREKHKTEIDEAATPADVSELCNNLLKASAGAKVEPSEKFAYCQLVIELATKANDVKSAFNAFDDIARSFDYDNLSAQSRTYTTIAPKLNPRNFHEAAMLGIALTVRAVNDDQFDTARIVSQHTAQVVEKYGTPEMKQLADAQRDEVDRLKIAYDAAVVANATLRKNPADRDANMVSGKYQIEKGNWDVALARLAAADDARFRDLAIMELEKKKNTNERLSVADGWWFLALSDRTPFGAQLRKHSIDLYGKIASEELSEPTKKKIEFRTAEHEKLPKSPLALALPKPPADKGTADQSPTGAPDDPTAPRIKIKSSTNSIGMRLNLIPPGEFLMGSPDNELGQRGRHNDSEKQHRVRITKPFHIGVYPVTRGEFAKFVAAEKFTTEAEKDGKGASGFDTQGKLSQKPEYSWRNPGMMNNQPQDDNHPVVCVSWNDAVAFCEWLSKKEGVKYRLPTEAEWEYACRAGTKTPFNFGTALNGTDANCNGDHPYGTFEKGDFLKGTVPVGSYQPNAFGLYDMHGNASQWCADWYDASYYGLSPVDDPPGPTTGSNRIFRGGGWNNHAVFCRSAVRFILQPDSRYSYIGFRIVQVP